MKFKSFRKLLIKAIVFSFIITDDACSYERSISLILKDNYIFDRKNRHINTYEG